MCSKLRSPFYNDVPRAFYCNTTYGRESNICGPYALTMLNYAYYHNMCLSFDYMENRDQETTMLNNKDLFDVSVNPSVYLINNNSLNYSYPLEWLEECIMVPLEDEIPKYLYVIWPYGPYIWSIILFSPFLWGIVMRYIAGPYRKGRVTNSITRNIIFSIVIMLYNSNMSIRLVNLNIRQLLFYTLLLSGAFILNAYYMPYFTTYHMKPVFTKPITTPQDLIDANIDVLVPFSHLDQMKQDPYINLMGLEHLMVGVSLMDFQGLLRSLNRSFAYVLYQDQWNFIHKRQRNLLKPYFHITRMCFNFMFTSFLINSDENRTESIDFFILQIQQAGLWNKWEEDAFNRATLSGYITILRDSYPVEPLKVDFFICAWLVLFVGFLASLFSFIIELYIEKRNKPRKRKRIRGTF